MSVKVTATVRGDAVEIVSAGSTAGEIAGALLAAATDPAQVRTVTTVTGMGWQVPVAVAEIAGMLAKPTPDPAPTKPATAGRRSRKK